MCVAISIGVIILGKPIIIYHQILVSLAYSKKHLTLSNLQPCSYNPIHFKKIRLMGSCHHCIVFFSTATLKKL